MERRDLLRAARWVQLPVTSVEPATGSSPELAVALVLHRAQGGGVAKLGPHYLDHGLPMPALPLLAANRIPALGPGGRPVGRCGGRGGSAISQPPR